MPKQDRDGEDNLVIAARKRIAGSLFERFGLNPELCGHRDIWTYPRALAMAVLSEQDVDDRTVALALAFDASFVGPVVLVSEAVALAESILPRDASARERCLAILAAQAALRSRARLPKPKRGQQEDRRSRMEAALRGGGWTVPEIAEMTDQGPGDREAVVHRVEQRIARCRRREGVPAVLQLAS